MDFIKKDDNTLEKEIVTKETVTKDQLLKWKESLESQLVKCNEQLKMFEPKEVTK